MLLPCLAVPDLGLFFTLIPPPPIPFRMISGVLTGLLFGKIGYYLVLAWCCVSIFVFMVSGAWVGKAEASGPLRSLGRSLEHPSTKAKG